MRIICLVAIVLLIVGSLRASAPDGVSISFDADRLRLSSSERSFGVSIRVNTNDGYGCYPLIATDEVGGVYAAWMNYVFSEGTYDCYTQLMFAYSHDRGASWSEGVMISDNASQSVSCSTPSVAVDRQNSYVYVAWQDNRTGRTNVYVDKSSDRGVSFGQDVKANDNDVMLDNPVGLYAVNIDVANDGRVFVAWEDSRANPTGPSDIFLAYSIDNGGTFSPNVRVNQPDSTVFSAFPWIAVDQGGVVYVAYSIGGTVAGVYATRSLDGGASFEVPVKVNDDSASYYRGKKEIAISASGKIYVVWTDSRAGGGGTKYWDIYLTSSSDSGLTFGPNVRVNDDPQGPPNKNTSQGSPSLVIDSHEGVHVVWEDFRNYNATSTHVRDIYYSYSTDGISFSKNAKVNYLPDATEWNCADASMDIDSDDNLYIAWADGPYGPDYYWNYFAFSLDVPTELESDLNGDGTVNILDISIVARAFDTEPRDANWNPAADIDDNGVINILDISKVAKDYGKTR